MPLGSWSPGKSSDGSSRSVPSYAAQRMCAWERSVSTSTGASESDFTVSPSRRAGTSATPASVTWASVESRAETSRSVVVSVMRPSSVASTSTPVSAGMPGLDETPRCTVCSASDRASRSQRNFTSVHPLLSSFFG